MALGTGAGGVGTYQVTPPQMVVVEVWSAGTGDLRQPAITAEESAAPSGAVSSPSPDSPSDAFEGDTRSFPPK
jgi:hypothetical protein